MGRKIQPNYAWLNDSESFDRLFESSIKMGQISECVSCCNMRKFRKKVEIRAGVGHDKFGLCHFDLSTAMRQNEETKNYLVVRVLQEQGVYWLQIDRNMYELKDFEKELTNFPSQSATINRNYHREVE